MLSKSKKARGKVKGGLLIEAIIGMVIISVLSVIIISSFGPINKKTDVENIYRKYSFKSMCAGYLNSSEQDNLKKELEDIGCTDVVISSNASKVKWGDEIGLVVECNIDVTELTIGDNETFPSIEKTSKRIRMDKRTVSMTT